MLVDFIFSAQINKENLLDSGFTLDFSPASPELGPGQMDDGISFLNKNIIPRFPDSFIMSGSITWCWDLKLKCDYWHFIKDERIHNRGLNNLHVWYHNNTKILFTVLFLGLLMHCGLLWDSEVQAQFENPSYMEPKSEQEVGNLWKLLLLIL